MMTTGSLVYRDMPVTDGVRTVLRIEGLALLAVALLLYRNIDANWLLFAGSFCCPTSACRIFVRSQDRRTCLQRRAFDHWSAYARLGGLGISVVTFASDNTHLARACGFRPCAGLRAQKSERLPRHPSRPHRPFPSAIGERLCSSDIMAPLSPPKLP